MWQEKRQREERDFTRALLFVKLFQFVISIREIFIRMKIRRTGWPINDSLMIASLTKVLLGA